MITKLLFVALTCDLVLHIAGNEPPPRINIKSIVSDGVPIVNVMCGSQTSESMYVAAAGSSGKIRGPPGKAGPQGIPGAVGPVGPRGKTGKCTCDISVSEVMDLKTELMEQKRNFDELMVEFKKLKSTIRPMCDPQAMEIENGASTCTDGNFIGSSCQFQCSAGYILQNNVTLNCVKLNGNYQWDQISPTCEDAFLGKVFFMINKDFPSGRLTQFRGGNIGTFSGGIYTDQKWRIEADPSTPGFYYIQNYARRNRLKQWGTDVNDVGAPNGEKSNEALWRLEPINNNQYEYRIWNYVYNSSRLTYWPDGGIWKDFGIYSGDINYYADDQVWVLKEELTQND